MLFSEPAVQALKLEFTVSLALPKHSLESAKTPQVKMASKSSPRPSNHLSSNYTLNLLKFIYPYLQIRSRLAQQQEFWSPRAGHLCGCCWTKDRPPSVLFPSSFPPRFPWRPCWSCLIYSRSPFPSWSSFVPRSKCIFCGWKNMPRLWPAKKPRNKKSKRTSWCPCSKQAAQRQSESWCTLSTESEPVWSKGTRRSPG